MLEPEIMAWTLGVIRFYFSQSICLSNLEEVDVSKSDDLSLISILLNKIT